MAVLITRLPHYLLKVTSFFSFTFLSHQNSATDLRSLCYTFLCVEVDRSYPSGPGHCFVSSLDDQSLLHAAPGPDSSVPTHHSNIKALFGMKRYYFKLLFSNLGHEAHGGGQTKTIFINMQCIYSIHVFILSSCLFRVTIVQIRLQVRILGNRTKCRR